MLLLSWVKGYLIKMYRYPCGTLADIEILQYYTYLLKKKNIGSLSIVKQGKCGQVWTEGVWLMFIQFNLAFTLQGIPYQYDCMVHLYESQSKRVIKRKRGIPKDPGHRWGKRTCEEMWRDHTARHMSRQRHSPSGRWRKDRQQSGLSHTAQRTTHNAQRTTHSTTHNTQNRKPPASLGRLWRCRGLGRLWRCCVTFMNPVLQLHIAKW